MKTKTDEKAEELKEMLRNVELDVVTSYSLADAIREGSSVTDGTVGWGNGIKACALHAAVIAAKARNYM